jgi:hypothetical protein
MIVVNMLLHLFSCNHSISIVTGLSFFTEEELNLVVFSTQQWSQKFLIQGFSNNAKPFYMTLLHGPALNDADVFYTLVASSLLVKGN